MKPADYGIAERTGDLQMTRGIRNILAYEGTKNDLIAFMFDRNLLIYEDYMFIYSGI